MIFNMSGGGANLNFAVYGGTNAPVSPKENDIWINTDTEITSWAFSVDEPTNPEEGKAWFYTGASSVAPINILKDNGVMVYPMSAKQYIGVAWVDKYAKTYINGEWTDWAIFILDGLNHYETLTGGWHIYGSGSVAFTDKGMEIANSTSNTGNNDVRTVNAFDFSNYTRLCFDVELATNYTSLQVGIRDSTAWGGGAWLARAEWKGNWNNPEGTIGKRTLELDISAVTSGHIVVVGDYIVGAVNRIYWA